VIRLEKFDNLSKYVDIKHFITTREGGISLPPFQFANMSLENSDEFTIENRKLLAKQLDISFDRFVYQYQTHTNNVTVVTEKFCGFGTNDINTAIQGNDAMITNQKNICLLAMAADCVPILLYDFENKVVAAIHAGWKGTHKRIVQKKKKKMEEEFNSLPINIIAGIGPSIGKCCYEVGYEVYENFKNEFKNYSEIFELNLTSQKYHIDLWQVNKLQMLEMGLKTENIEIKNQCSKCNKNIYYSARNGDLGRFTVGICLS